MNVSAKGKEKLIVICHNYANYQTGMNQCQQTACDSTGLQTECLDVRGHSFIKLIWASNNCETMAKKGERTRSQAALFEEVLQNNSRAQWIGRGEGAERQV